MANSSQELNTKNASKISKPNADLVEISTYVELEALALSWAIRNKQVFFAKHQSASEGRKGAEDPFGLPDPTRGATHFHHHNDVPPWAAMHEPVALIGSYLFYDLRANGDTGTECELRP